MAGLNQNAISDIVNGKVREISLRTCKALARLFNTPLEEVLRLAGHIEYSEDMALKELMEVAMSLTPEDHRELLEYARWRYSRHAREEVELYLIDLLHTNLEGEMYVYIVKLVTHDGFAIKHVCATPEKAIEISMVAGHKYLLTGGSKHVAADRDSLAKQLLDGKEFYLANTPDWSGDLIFVSRYAVV
jgi:transcriptional regulator with XRE-family HTH domain